MNLSGKWLVRAKINDETGKVSYRTTIVNKTMDGEKEYATIFLNLVKDAKDKPIDDKTYIEVKPENAWLGFYKIKNDKGEEETIFVAKVKDFEMGETLEDAKVEIEPVEDDDDLPF
jgi:hypothetical protein